MRIKQQYGEDIKVEVAVHTIQQSDALHVIEQLNHDDSVHGIIVQIPLPDPSQSDMILNSVLPSKDVDGLGVATTYMAPTPAAIYWLLTGYDISLDGKKIVIVGQGRLVGKPLATMWQQSGYSVTTTDKKTNNLAQITKTADILVCATGVPGLITADTVKSDAVVVDAGVATDNNGLVGDVAEDVRTMPGVIITPRKGGVGPLTVAALFENVITAARHSIPSKLQ
jgi:methylenetetrahydrofolate dehydrogenase (NADP+)/methenyltetrahydrofolate cyclohydrolase